MKTDGVHKLDAKTEPRPAPGYLRRLALLFVMAAAVTAASIAQESTPQGASSTSAQPPSTPVGADAASGAQGPLAPNPKEDAGQFVFKKKVEEVVLRAVVVDSQNHLISGLDREAFSIYEDGNLQKMTSFHRENVPLALGILIDNSGSMRSKRQAVNEAALNLVRSSNAGDQVFVVNFGEEYYLDQDFTDNVAKLKAALDRVETRGSTALYDAVVASAAHIRESATLQKRVLLVVTDGRDNASQESLEETVHELQRADGPVVYVIAFVDQTKGATASIHALQTISQNTGGTAYFPKDPSEVDTITKSIAFDIRNQYVIGYKSSNTASGHTFHSIEVQAYDANHHRLRVRTRTGYFTEASATSDSASQ